MAEFAPITPTGKGDYWLRLADDERNLLRSLPDQLRQMLAEDDPSVARLFPPAYVEDLKRDAEYRKYMREELVNRRLESMAVVEATVDADRLTEEQLNAWVKVINDLRLVMGTILDIQQDDDNDNPLDPDDPQAPMMSVYWYLSVLLESSVEALSESL